MIRHLKLPVNAKPPQLKRRSTVSLIAGLVVSAGFLMVSASKSEAGGTRIETLSLAPLPEAATIEIRLPVEEGSDDLKLSVVLADHISILLGERGYTTVDRGAELVLRFAVEEPTYAINRNPFRQASLVFGARQDGKDSSANLQNALLGEGDEDTYRLRISVARERKPPLWTGYIERSVKGAERKATYIVMADRLMTYWGRTHSRSN